MRIVTATAVVDPLWEEQSHNASVSIPSTEKGSSTICTRSDKDQLWRDRSVTRRDAGGGPAALFTVVTVSPDPVVQIGHDSRYKFDSFLTNCWFSARNYGTIHYNEILKFTEIAIEWAKKCKLAIMLHWNHWKSSVLLKFKIWTLIWIRHYVIGVTDGITRYTFRLCTTGKYFSQRKKATFELIPRWFSSNSRFCPQENVTWSLITRCGNRLPTGNLRGDPVIVHYFRLLNYSACSLLARFGFRK